MADLFISTPTSVSLSEEHIILADTVFEFYDTIVGRLFRGIGVNCFCREMCMTEYILQESNGMKKYVLSSESYDEILRVLQKDYQI